MPGRNLPAELGGRQRFVQLVHIRTRISGIATLCGRGVLADLCCACTPGAARALRREPSGWSAEGGFGHGDCASPPATLNRAEIPMKAQEIMTKNPRVVTPETTVREAAKLMESENVGMIPVVRSAGSKSVVGIVTDRDIAIRHVAAGHNSSDCPVSEAMSSNPKTCKTTDSVDDVMK